MAEKNTEARWYVAHTYSGYENKEDGLREDH